MIDPLESLWVILAWPRISASEVEVSSPFIFASRPWATAPTDTPAAQRAHAICESIEVAALWHDQQEDGLQLFGGVGQYSTVPVKILNPRTLQPDDTYSAPLDDLEDYLWDEARAEIWGSDPVDGSLDIALASLTRLGKFVVESFTPGTGSAGLQLGRPKTLEAPCTPFELRGWGTMGQAPATRADVSAMRNGSSDFSFRIGVLFLVDNLAGPYQCFAAPLLRLMKNNANIHIEIRNAAGSWQAFSTVAISAFEVYQLGVTYNSSTFEARLFMAGPLFTDAQFLETITITSGLFTTAASAATVWDDTTEENFFSGTEWLTSNKGDDWMLENLIRGVQYDEDSVLSFAFDEGIGTILFDKAGIQDGDATNSWADTLEGRATLAGIRPAAIVGIGFGLPALQLTDSSKFIAGYAGDRACGSFTNVMSLTQDGRRKKPDVPTGTSGTRTINATRDTIAAEPLRADFTAVQLQFASTQALTRSPAGGAGNPTNFTVNRFYGDAVLGNAGLPTAISTTTDQTADETSAFAITDNADSEYSAASIAITRNVTDYVLPRISISGFTPEGVLQIQLGRAENDEDMSAIDHACRKFGPQLTPNITYESTATDIWYHGWRSEGDRPFSELIHQLALSSLSVDNGPLGVAFEPDGDIEIYGMRLAADASDDIPLFSENILDITPVQRRAVPTRVKVRYRRNWQVLEIAESIAGVDDLLRRLRTEWDERPSGTGSRTGIFESSLTRHPDAVLQADALKRLQKFELYNVELYGPLTFSTIATATAGPFRQVTITWDKNSFWTSRVAWTVGFRGGQENGRAKLTLTVATEKT